jgi:hypothetical protein
MSHVDPTQAVIALDELEVRDEPFPYLVAGRALRPATADTLLEWLPSAPWKLHASDFFEQYECDLRSVELPPECAELLSPAALAQVRARLGRLFGCELAERVTATAHKLVVGQGIGLHNDAPHGLLETHRLVIHLGDDFEDRFGGHLVFFSSKDSSDVNRIFRPLHNTGVGFAMSERSYHAVSDVSEGERYTVVLSFWDEDVLARGGQPGELGELVRVLRASGAGDISHSDGDLLDHLIGTYRILERWGCDESLKRAGLYHSAYGTAEFRSATLPLSARQEIRNAIGEPAERLAYLYCVGDRGEFYSELAKEPPYKLVDFRDGSELPVSEDELADLAVLDAANTIEQLPRVSIPAERLRDEREAYEQAARLLPEAVLVELRAAYAA